MLHYFVNPEVKYLKEKKEELLLIYLSVYTLKDDSPLD